MRHTLLLIAAALALVAPAAHAEPSGPPAASEEVGTEKVVISAGHVDLGLRQIDGAWVLMARDDTVSPPVWRHTEDVVFHVGDEALAEVPAEDAYSFLGVDGGAKVHVIPQTENPATVWLGWNTQAPETIATFPRGADLELVKHSGAGALHLFLANGFDAPLKLWNSTEPPGQKVHMEPNTHVHANWIFTAPGRHTVDVAAHGVAADGSTVTAPATLHFAVGPTPPAFPERAPATVVPEPGSATEEPAGSKGSEADATPVPERAPARNEPGTTKGYATAAAALAVAVAGGLWLRSRAAARRAEAWKDAE